MQGNTLADGEGQQHARQNHQMGQITRPNSMRSQERFVPHGTTTLHRDMAPRQKCCNNNALFDDVEIEARTREKRDAIFEIGWLVQSGNPNGKVRVALFCDFAEDFHIH